MTYRLNLLCREGIVIFSDPRSSASVDNITIQLQLPIHAVKGDREL